MSFLRRLVPGLPGRDNDSDEEGEGEALLEHEDYSSSESESSSTINEEGMGNGGESRLPRCLLAVGWPRAGNSTTSLVYSFRILGIFRLLYSLLVPTPFFQLLLCETIH